jgi:hypothetical protein
VSPWFNHQIRGLGGFEKSLVFSTALIPYRESAPVFPDLACALLYSRLVVNLTVSVVALSVGSGQLSAKPVLQPFAQNTDRSEQVNKR